MTSNFSSLSIVDLSFSNTLKISAQLAAPRSDLKYSLKLCCIATNENKKSYDYESRDKLLKIALKFTDNDADSNPSIIYVPGQYYSCTLINCICVLTQ